MKPKTVAYLAMIAAITLFQAGPASATIITVGPPLSGSSWTQNFEAGIPDLTRLEAFIITAITPIFDPEFESPGMVNFTEPGWSSNVINPKYALATGPANDLMSFDVVFTDSMENQFFFLDFLAYTDPNFTFFLGFRYRWDQVNFEFIDFSPDLDTEYDRTAVPEPSTLLLLGFGLAGLAFMRRRRKVDVA